MSAHPPQHSSLPPPDIEEDPYQVYMLRHPAERASSIIPQLPKQPEMAETRLRYRRIAPEARSGSVGSLGNHFPARFQFPHRRSLLESLTSDDDAPNSFAIHTRKDKSKRKRKRKRKRKQHSKPSLSNNNASSVAPIAIAPPDQHASDDDSTPVSTSPTTPLPASPTCNVNALVLRDHYQHVVSAHGPCSYQPLSAASHPLASQLPRVRIAPKEHAQLEHVASAKDMDSDEHVLHPKWTHRAQSEHVKRVVKHTRLHSEQSHMRSLENTNMDMDMDMDKDKERNASGTGVAEVCVLRFVDGRRIAAPAAMSAEMKAQFVLMVEQPVIYVRKKREGEGEGKTGRTGKKRATRKKVEEKKQGRVEKEEEAGVARDREVSVSFAQRKMTAEEAAWKPWDALQRLLHAIAFVRVLGLKGGKSR